MRLNKKIKVAKPLVGEEEGEAIREVLLSGRYVAGPKVKEFENEFSKYIETKYAIALNSGTAALHVSLASLGIGPGDEVIIPPITFFSTVSSVLHQNALPVFADIDHESFCLSSNDIKSKITDKTKAIIPVHLFGNAAEMDENLEIAKEYDLKVIEDCAQAHGTEYKSKKVGSIGDAGCFSFYATKHMTTGEGGMITTNNEELAEKARIIRNHGMVNRDEHIMLGYNYRMSEINAAIGLIQLKKLDKLNQKRIENSLYLLNKIRDKIDWVKVPEIKDYIKHTFFWCPVVILEDKAKMRTQEVVNKLKSEGVETRYRYKRPLYKQKLLQNLSANPKSCPFACSNNKIKYEDIYLPNAEELSGKIIGLPNHPDLDKDELDYIVDILDKIGE